MKRIYNTLFVICALLIFAPFANAQSINEVIPGLSWPKAAENGLQTPEGSDFAYSKDISAPLSDGTYWIKLESFSTGAATTILSSTPSDIILILDSSTSMNTQDYGGTVSYSPRQSQSYSYNTFHPTYGTAPTCYYYYEGNYYLITCDRTSNGNNGIRYLTFTANGTQYYLSGNNTAPTTTLSGANSNGGTIWTGVLHTRSVTGAVTRIQALQDATNLFIDNIYQNDVDVTSVNPSYPGNRIAIITYDASAHPLTSAQATYSGQPGYGWNQGDAYWFDIGSSDVKNRLQNSVNNITRNNWTRPDLGMSEAISDLLSGTTSATRKRPEANLVVVLFTDGVPCHSQGSGNTFEAQDANNAIYQASILKKTYDATIYSVGLLPDSNTNDIKCGRYFLDLLSSNYPDATIAQNSTSAWNVNGDSITVNGLTTGTKDPEGNYFQLVGAGTDLSSIFDSISQQSGGSSSQLSAASRNVDVVSNSFIIPLETGENINNKVKIFIAKVSGYDATKQELTFSTEILKGNLPDSPTDPTAAGSYYYYPLDEHGDIDGDPIKADAGISVSYNQTTKAVTVTGFDYSSCFCGPIFETNYIPSNPITAEDLTHVIRWQGFKIIIMIPIKMNPDAVGGPDVNTNGAGSGIFISSDDGEAFVTFKSPTVSLPVNIYIEKSGLGKGESAKFKIERAEIPDLAPGQEFDPTTIPDDDWSYVSTVFVTQSNDPSLATTSNPVVKVRGLPANEDTVESGVVTGHKSFVYRVTEESWSWSYTPDTPPQYTTTEDVINPFLFSNTKRDNIDVKVRHAESKATNVFVTGAAVKYDDSKDNGR